MRIKYDKSDQDSLKGWRSRRPPGKFANVEINTRVICNPKKSKKGELEEI